MKEHVKTVLLIGLAVCMAFLIWQTWAYEPAILEALSGWGASVPPSMPEGGDPYVNLNSVVLPAQLAQWRDGVRMGAFWDSDAVSRAMRQISLNLDEALGSAAVPEPATVEDWMDAMSQESVYLRYTDAVPLLALGAWSFGPEVQARRLALCAEDGNLRLFYEDADGNLFTCASAALTDLEDLLLETPCFFAFEREGIKSEPLQLFPGEIPVLPGISAERREDGPAAAAHLLRALGIDPNTPFYSRRPDGTVTYVDFQRSCSITADGHIYYIDPVPNERLLTPITQPPLLGYIEAARMLCGSVSNALGDAAWELRGIEYKGGSTIIRFGVQVNGCPVLGQGSAYALLTVTGGRLEEAHLYIRPYHRLDSAAALMPLEQSLASVPQNREGFSLTAAYLDNGEANLTAQWSIANNGAAIIE